MVMVMVCLTFCEGIRYDSMNMCQCCVCVCVCSLCVEGVLLGVLCFMTYIMYNYIIVYISFYLLISLSFSLPFFPFLSQPFSTDPFFSDQRYFSPFLDVFFFTRYYQQWCKQLFICSILSQYDVGCYVLSCSSNSVQNIK